MSDIIRRNSRMESQRLLFILGLAHVFIWNVTAYTATTHHKWIHRKTRATKLFGAYEDYMDALQKQQQQHKSFMALNTASAYETEHLKVNVPPLEDSTASNPLMPLEESNTPPSNALPQMDIAMANADVVSNPSPSRRYYFDYSDTAKFNFEQQDPSQQAVESFIPPEAPSAEFQNPTYDETVKFNFEQQEPPASDSYVSQMPLSGSFDETLKSDFEHQEPPASDESANSFEPFGTTIKPAFDASSLTNSQVSPPKRNFSVSSASWKSSPSVSVSRDSLVSPPADDSVGPPDALASTPSCVTPSPPLDFSVTSNSVATPSSEPLSASVLTSTFYNDYNMMTATESVNCDEGRPVFPSYVYENAKISPDTETTISSSLSSTSEKSSDLTAQEHSSVSTSISSESSTNYAETGSETIHELEPPSTNTSSENVFNAGLTKSDDGRPIFPSYVSSSTETKLPSASTDTDAISTDYKDPLCSSTDLTSASSTDVRESSEDSDIANENGNSRNDDSFSWSTASKPVDQEPKVEINKSGENLDVPTSTNENNWGNSDENRLWTFDELKNIDEKSNSFMSNESFLQAITSSEPISPVKELEMADENIGPFNFGSAPGFSAISSFWKKSSLLRSLELSLQNDKNSESDKVSSLASTYSQVTVEAPPDVPSLDTRGMTERIMKRIDAATNARNGSSSSSGSGAGGSTSYEAFLRVEDNWTKLKQSSSKSDRKSSAFAIRSPFVTSDAGLGNPRCWNKLREQAKALSTSAATIEASKTSLDYDVVICGGTLGIFFALALLLRNPKYRICVVESAPAIRGRDQEWNISYNELYELVKLGVLTQSDVEDVITTEFPGCRSGFKNKEITPLNGGYFENNVGYECVTNDVLNLGVSPSLLLERVSQRFRQLGGIIRADTRLYGVTISDTVGAALDIGETNEPITTHLLLDCMGNASPISRQQRDGMKPDGVCAVVGSCAAGFDPITNIQGDIIYTMNPIQDKGENGKLQYFWEAFPVGIGRNGMAPGTSNVKTTYMFTYMDADEKRPSLETLMEDYWRMLPIYQPSIKNPETDLDVKRVLFAYFPTYTDSPLKPVFSRILPVGDASGIQSPLSFGGFGALTRHLDRIVTAVDEALDQGLLQKEFLGEINAYAPNLSAAWMFQKAMSVKMGQNVNEAFVNRLLAVNFEVMNNMGQRTIKPFLQDVIRFDGLVGSLARGFIADPTFMPEIVVHVGIPRLADWLGHVSMMGLYSFLDTFGAPLLKPVVNNMNDPAEKFLWRRRMDAWKFGCGNDYELPEEN